MIHAIEFRSELLAEVDRPEYAFVAQVVIQKGTSLHADVRPYVAESDDGPLEVADLYLEDGSIVRAVRFAAFRFLDRAKRRKE